MRTLIYAAALSLMAHAAIAQPCRQIFTLWNDTSVSIVAIYASGSDRKLFGPNMMPKGRVLAPGYRTTINPYDGSEGRYYDRFDKSFNLA